MKMVPMWLHCKIRANIIAESNFFVSHLYLKQQLPIFNSILNYFSDILSLLEVSNINNHRVCNLYIAKQVELYQHRDSSLGIFVRHIVLSTV